MNSRGVITVELCLHRLHVINGNGLIDRLELLDPGVQQAGPNS